MRTNKSDRELILEDADARRELRKKSRRSFLIGGVAAGAAIAGYEWLTKAPREDELPWPQRRVLDFNGSLWHKYVKDRRLLPTYSSNQVGWLKPNGDIGLEQPVAAGDWHVRLMAPDQKPQQIALSDITSLPKVEMITRFCCIEGWSTIVHWGGVRFSDFTRKFLASSQRLANYVYMATPGEDYYVGLDIKSALHPQTLLAFEQNGKPLEDRHGAPLRLVIPVKYGIKNIKRIGFIRFMDSRPGDYWAEDGYDWFAGL
jgi:DMSO/TMAO reductase YedYZ molybdopterin-dependent catalytic subunit